ncbi:MAG: ATPase domain-containing protein [Candidatus Hydrothermarchaeota archaeon]
MREDRVKSGIPGLDEILDGGFPRNTVVLVSGGPGTGKTLFCFQFLYAGASKFNEPSIYVSLEERPDDVRREMQVFGWDVKKLEEDGKFVIIDASLARAGIPTRERVVTPAGFDLDALAVKIYETIEEIGAKRIAIDSIPALGLQLKSEAEIRRAIHKFTTILLESNCTSILTSESIEGTGRLSRYGVEEFITRGLILLYLTESGGQLRRSIVIRKMREARHGMRRYPLEITSRGLVVYPKGEYAE